MGFLTDWLARRVASAEMETVTGELQEVLYYQKLALFIAKSYIANTISKCEFRVTENGEEVQDELYYALNVCPNPNQSSSQFLNMMINRLYDTNRCLVVPIKQRLYVADSFQIETHPLRENVFTDIYIEQERLSRSLKAGEVFYFQLDERGAKSLLDGLFGVYSKLIASAISSFRRNNGQKYKLLIDAVKAGDRDFMDRYNNVVVKQLQAFIEGDNTVFPQFKGTDLQTLGGTEGQASSEDVIALRKEIFEVVAQALKIPMPMMYGNITNMQEIVKVYLTYCIDPLADMISEEITRKINTFATWQQSKRSVRVDTTRINHVDIFEVAESADKLISSGVCCVDEIRVRLDMQPLGTEFSGAHWITKNYTSAENESGEVSEE